MDVKHIIQKTNDILNSNDINQVIDVYYNHINPHLMKLIKLAGYAKLEYKSKGEKITNSENEEYIDCLGLYGAILLGHNNEYILQKVIEQMQKQCMPTKVFLSALNAAASYLLANISQLKYVFFTNSGAESVEGAIKLALASTKRRKIISCYNSYHGKTLGALSVTGREVYKKNIPSLLDVIFVEYGKIEDVENNISEDVAAIIVEPIQGEGGIILPPLDYLPKLRELCDKYGCLLIIDEVQTGLGRTGIIFEHQRYNIKPDILVLAKALGGGIVPVGAIVSNEKGWKAFDENPLFHTSTFGSNPIALSAVIATIEFIYQNNVLDQINKKGQYFIKKLQNIKKFPIIADVRGRGLMIGIELNDQQYAASVFSYLIQNKIITAYTLNQPKVIRIEPPYNISFDSIDYVVDKISEAIEHTIELFELV